MVAKDCIFCHLTETTNKQECVRKDIGILNTGDLIVGTSTSNSESEPNKQLTTQKIQNIVLECQNACAPGSVTTSICLLDELFKTKPDRYSENSANKNIPLLEIKAEIAK